MTTFYIAMDDDGPEELNYDSNILGTESFGKFYAERGMGSLESIVENHPEKLKNTKIFTDTGVSFTITEFLDHLNKLKVLFN